MFTEEGLSVLMLSPILAFPARQASAERVSRVLHPLNLLPVCHTMASSSPKATFCFTACLMLSRCVSRGNGESKGKEQRQECNSTSAIYAPCSPLMRQQRPIVGFSQGRCQRDKR